MNKTMQLSTCPECNHKVRYRDLFFNYFKLCFRLRCPNCKIRLKGYPNEKARRLSQIIILLAIGHMVVYGFLPDIDNMTEQELAKHTFTVDYVYPIMTIVGLLFVIALLVISKVTFSNNQFTTVHVFGGGQMVSQTHPIALS